MRIPHRFKLLGYTVEVDVDNDFSERTGSIGWNLIHGETLKLKSPGAMLCRHGVEHTFCHELTHMILAAMNKRELYEDEEFVDMFGGLLHQALASFAGEIEL